LAAKHLLAGASLIFLVLGCARAMRSGIAHPQARVWLLVAIIFGLVSGYLYVRE
jgi:hypothetical protein